jgi:hypothetical protein
MQVSWVNKSGNMEMARTRALDVSEHGIALQLPEEAMPARVQFRSEWCIGTWTGIVRYCRRMPGKCLVGVEFDAGLQWRAPEVEAHRPIPLCAPKSIS